MRRCIVLFFLFALMASLISGCSQMLRSPHDIPWDGNFVTISYEIADRLENNLRYPIPPDEPILVTSLVNVDQLEESTTIGRMMSEQIASRLSQNGYKVIEMKLRTKSVYIKRRAGEFLLSRDLKEISNDHQANTVVVGTYGGTRDQLYVSVRIVRTTDSVIVSSCDACIPVGEAYIYRIFPSR
ncbi:MAG: hypothetical protein KKB20_09995 [Proteobacteria bacterium]|nr:hypothetical protein [Pseudomonadota bacterium]